MFCIFSIALVLVLSAYLSISQSEKQENKTVENMQVKPPFPPQPPEGIPPFFFPNFPFGRKRKTSAMILWNVNFHDEFSLYCFL